VDRALKPIRLAVSKPVVRLRYERMTI